MVTLRSSGHSRTLWGYLGRGLLLNALVALVAFVAILGIAATIKVTDQLQVPLVLIVRVLFFASVAQLIYALPVALLFGAGFLVGRLQADRELLALRSFGISTWQLLVPVACIGTVFACVSYYLNDTVVPRFRYATRNIQSLVFENIGSIGEGWRKDFRFGSQSIWIYHHDGPLLEGISIALKKDDPAAEQLVSKERLEKANAVSYPVQVIAARGEIVSEGVGSDSRIAVRLYGVNVLLASSILRHEDGGGAGSEGRFLDRIWIDPFTYYPPSPDKDPSLKDRTGSSLRTEVERRRRELETLEPGATAERRKRGQKRLNEVIAVGHRRLALALSALTFPVAAFALGLRLRSANRLLPFFLASTIIPATYFTLGLVGDGLAEDGVLPGLTAQLGNLALLAVCVASIVHERYGGLLRRRRLNARSRGGVAPR